MKGIYASVGLGLIMATFKVAEVLSMTPEGVITFQPAELMLYVLATAAFVFVMLPIRSLRPTEGNMTKKLFSRGGGISAVALGVLAAVTGIMTYNQDTGARFTLSVAILGAASALIMVFIVAVLNFTKLPNFYSKNAKGFSVIFVVWLAVSVICMFFVNRTVRLVHLNAFTLLTFAAFIFFFLSYAKEISGFGNEKSHKNVARFSLLSIAYAIPAIAAKIAYRFIVSDGIIAQPFGSSVAGILFDVALLAFAMSAAVGIYSPVQPESRQGYDVDVNTPSN